MLFVTTAPAAITTRSQIFTGKIVALEPIETLLPMLVFSTNFYRHGQGRHQKKDH